MRFHLYDRQSSNGLEDMGKGSHTMNRCGYHEEEFQFAGLAIGEMRRGACGFRGWESLRDGAPSDWKAEWWWKTFHSEQVEPW